MMWTEPSLINIIIIIVHLMVNLMVYLMVNLKVYLNPLLLSCSCLVIGPL